MTFKELTAKYPMLMEHDSHEHPSHADPSASHEIWHNLLMYCGYKFASHIHEYLYDDGTSKLFIMYSSLTREKFDDYIKQDDFMGDFCRGLEKIYPDLNYALHPGMRQLDTPENLAKFDEVLKHIKKLPKPEVKVTTLKEETSTGDDE